MNVCVYCGHEMVMHVERDGRYRCAWCECSLETVVKAPPYDWEKE